MDLDVLSFNSYINCYYFATFRRTGKTTYQRFVLY